jgi:hypothetical protein
MERTMDASSTQVDLMSADLLAGQLAELYGTYSHLQMLEGRDGNGPLDHEALPIPVALLEAAVEIKRGRVSKELDAVRLLLRMLWQAYDAGGTSVGRSFEARVVETAMMLMGAPQAPVDVSRQGIDLLKRCEDRAYDITRVALNGDEWDAAVLKFRAAHERRIEADSDVRAQTERAAGDVIRPA